MVLGTLLFVFILKGGRDEKEKEAGKASQAEGMAGSGAGAGNSREKSGGEPGPLEESGEVVGQETEKVVKGYSRVVTRSESLSFATILIPK